MPNMSEQTKKAFDLSVEMTKLLITLSTAILGFLLTGILSNKPDSILTLVLQAHRCSTKWGVIFLVACVFFCILTILKITGLLASEKHRGVEEPSVYDGMTRLTFSLGLLSFLAGVVVLGLLSFRVLG